MRLVRAERLQNTIMFVNLGVLKHLGNTNDLAADLMLDTRKEATQEEYNRGRETL